MSRDRVEGKQVRELIVRPVLQELGLWSEAAEILVWGTGAHEGDGYDAVQQYGGPALSWWGIEPETYYDFLRNTAPGLTRSRSAVMVAYMAMVPKRYSGYPPAEHLIRDIGFACATCRLLYFRAPRALPAANDLPGLAAYWKQFYNTVHGKGTVEDWLANYRRHCEG
ncbi:MAG: hypothetical protein K2Y51_25995 [Gammaproteobacteria bacterium]|nr:hypothetical protein [Gammaproteobacteria bacterium]